jgi:hypothetical protein
MASITYEELKERGLEDGALKRFLSHAPINTYEAEIRGFAECLKKKIGKSNVELLPIDFDLSDGC